MFHRRPLDTIWHRLPIRHVSFKRRKQSMKDTRKIERSPRFPPHPRFGVAGGGVRSFGVFLCFCPTVSPSDPTGSPLPAGLPPPRCRYRGPARGSPAFRACPAPESQTRGAVRGGGERTFRPGGSERPGLPPFPSVPGFLLSYFCCCCCCCC